MRALARRLLRRLECALTTGCRAKFDSYPNCAFCGRRLHPREAP